jgi:hypothetical protein
VQHTHEHRKRGIKGQCNAYGDKRSLD